LKKKIIANIKRECTIRQRLTYYEYDDSDFSPVDDFLPRKRGPGRPKKDFLPERKQKLIPEISGD